MLETFRKLWKIKDLQKKVLYTFLMLLIYRLVGVIPAPGIDVSRLNESNNFMQLPLLNMMQMMTGNAFGQMTIMAMGITPYINASIIMQLLAVAFPSLQRMQEEEGGQEKMARITRYVTVGLAVFQAIGLSRAGGYVRSGWYNTVLVGLSMAGGSALAMWIGERITDKGIGNGISIILFAGIVSRIPALITQLFGGSGTGSYWSRGGVYYFLSPFVCVILILMVAFIVWMDNAERRIPVQYAKRVVGRKMYGGQNTHIPIKVNMSGVMPIIFAGSILSIPPTIQMFIPSAKLADSKFWTGFFKVFTSTHWAYGIIYFILIIAFAYFYSSIQYNPIEMSQNIAKNGGMIPGIRTGRPTSDYIARIISRITLLGALLLSVVAIFPIVFSQLTTLILTKTTVYADGMNVSLGGTSIIILVGVALETVKQLESQMMMRHYKGFLD